MSSESPASTQIRQQGEALDLIFSLIMYVQSSCFQTTMPGQAVALSTVHAGGNAGNAGDASPCMCQLRSKTFTYHT